MEFIMILLLISILLAYTFLIIFYLELRDMFIDINLLKQSYQIIEHDFYGEDLENES